MPVSSPFPFSFSFKVLVKGDLVSAWYAHSLRITGERSCGIDPHLIDQKSFFCSWVQGVPLRIPDHKNVLVDPDPAGDGSPNTGIIKNVHVRVDYHGISNIGIHRKSGADGIFGLSFVPLFDGDIAG